MSGYNIKGSVNVQKNLTADKVKATTATSIPDWAVSTDYAIGDVIKNVGVIYECNTGHTSDATTFSTDVANWDAVSDAGGSQNLASVLAQGGAATSSDLATVISDETGSGSLVFGTSPSLTTPDIGTPSAGNLTNCNSLPVSTDANNDIILGADNLPYLDVSASVTIASGDANNDVVAGTDGGAFFDFSAYGATTAEVAASTDKNYVTDAELSGLHTHANQAVLDATTASFTTAQETKLGFVSVTQAVDLDTMESDIATNNAKVSMTLVDNLTSTSTTDALTANQGKLLKDLVDGLGDITVVADTTARDALTGLDAGDIIHVIDNGSGIWQRWQVTSVTDGAWGTSTTVSLGDQNSLSAQTVISTDANNDVVAGTDSGAYLDLGNHTINELGVSTSNNLASILSDETGTGAVVFSNSPSLVTPDIGTPSSGNLANCHSLPASADANNDISLGTDNLPYVDVSANIPDNYILNTGDIGTGVYDFGGATSFEIPNSGSPVMTADGQIAVDTSLAGFTYGMLKFRDSGSNYVVPAMLQSEMTSGVDGEAIVYNGVSDEFQYAPIVSADANNDLSVGTDYGAFFDFSAYGATTAEVSASTDKNYVTDAQLTVIGNTSGTNTGDQVVVSTDANNDISSGTDTGAYFDLSANEATAISPQSDDLTGAVGTTGGKYALETHKHPAPLVLEATSGAGGTFALSVWRGTSAQYTALGSYDADTYYIIT